TTGASTAVKTGGGAAADTSAIHPGLAGATLADSPGGGVQVKAIEARSAAEQAKLRIGDHIEAANNKAVANLAELRDVAKHGGTGTLVLTIRRGNAVLLLPLRIP
ncbi:MAG TPA: PDZ domain-containing protein, partial [Steroidobacteraceae bacterium]|nr:PDZ domain-containing protein [Steroidobacteraceae bacterium]